MRHCDTHWRPERSTKCSHTLRRRMRRNKQDVLSHEEELIEEDMCRIYERIFRRAATYLWRFEMIAYRGHVIYLYLEIEWSSWMMPNGDTFVAFMPTGILLEVFASIGDDE